MGQHIRGRRPPAVVLVLALVVAACSSPGAGRGSATTRAAGTGANTAAPVPSAGCSSPGAASAETAAAVTEQRQDITVDGVARWYLVTTPPPHPGAGPLPVVVDLHGLAEGAALEANTTQFGPEAQHHDFIVVFPQGTGSPAGWDTDPATKAHPNHDIDFMNAMLDTLEAHLCVDTSRVYATGFSDGALLTSLLACTMADRFAAFAPVAGAVMPSPCRPGRRVPILAFHGTADPILYFNGGLGTAALSHDLGQGPAPSTTTPPPVDLDGKGYPANVRAWARKDGCDLRAHDAKVAAHVILRTYRCPPGAAVEFYIVLGAGHAWPGSKVSAALAFITGPSTFEIDATDLIWQFFRRQRLD